VRAVGFSDAVEGPRVRRARTATRIFWRHGNGTGRVGTTKIRPISHQRRAVICAVILVVAPLIPHHLAKLYWLHTALIALMVLLAYDLAELSSRGIAQLLSERVIDMLLGCAMALVGTAAAFPREAVADSDGLVGEPANNDDGSA
jgi:hypothetical protein